MDSSLQVHPVGSNDVQVEVITAEGRPVTTHPVRVDDLLQQRDHTLDVGDGISLRLEELNAQQHYSDDEESEDNSETSSFKSSDGDRGEEEEASDEDEQKIKGAMRSGRGRVGAPPGTQVTNDWYDVLDALRRERQDVELTAAEAEKTCSKTQESEGRLVTRNPNSLRTAATPLKRFLNAPSTEMRSIAGDRNTTPAPNASRREVWAFFAPPKDTVPHNYNVLRYVSYMSTLGYRRFRPTALAFHAAASYLNRKDRGQRLLVYGGLSSGAYKVEQELYEFSVLTGNWRRMEGKHLVPAGHYGHTLTVVEPLDRIVVVGGIGPGGAAVSKQVKTTWTEDPMRAPRYNFLCPLLHGGCGLVSGALAGGVTPATCGSATATTTTTTATIGFVSLLFDMSLSDLSWRAIQPAQPFPLVYHTAVHFDKEIFVFGGLTDDLRVSGQLLAINPETYAVRLVATAGTAGSVHSRRSRSGSRRRSAENIEAATSTPNDEAAGPGPRFLHTAVRYGPYMIVYGGYDTHNEVQKDCWAFDMMNERWERLRCRGEAAGRAGHECCVVGCRMIVTGGFECSLEEAGSNMAAPASTVMELNLLPTLQGEHLWRGAVKLRPALPPLAFTRCAPCGEDHSFLLFGGLTQLPRHSRSKSAGKRSESTKRRAREADDSVGKEDNARVEESCGGTQAKPSASGTESNTGHKGLLSRLAPFDDGLVFTFPVRHHYKNRYEDEPVVNKLGVEVDPNELPEHFKTFVRRQEDFIKKKDAAVIDTMRKVSMEEQESMEPTLYLTDDEINLLLQKSEACCEAFAQRYPMSSLPSNVPDREERVHLVEECISESRQVRDVLRSMKGSEAGITAVKSKTHRKRAGQKFEDYSAAKPFRRVVVVHLIASINTHLARMHSLNKALRTVDWAEKASFLEAVDDMQNSVHAVTRAINGVMRKYIQHRVDSLMKGVDKHKEVMRLLTQVVEKNRHDKIWGVEEARDEQRHQNQRAKAAITHAASTTVPTSSKKRPKAQKRSVVDRTTTGTRSRDTRIRSLGGGYHADESKAVVYLMDKEWSTLLIRTRAVEKCAKQLQQYCRDNISTAAPAGIAPATTGGGLLSLLQPQIGAAPVVAAAPQPSLPPPQLPTTLANPSLTGLPLPVLLGPSAAPAAAIALPETGGARPRDILIQQSNELRDKTASAAEEMGTAAAAFYATLTQYDAGKETAERHSGLSSCSISRRESQAGKAEAAAPSVPSNNTILPTPQLLPPPTAPTQGANQIVGASPSGSRSSSSTSTGTSRSSSLSSAASAAPAQMPAVPALASALLPPPPPTAGIMLPDQTGASHPDVKTSVPQDVEKSNRREGKQKTDAAAVTAVPAGHAMYLSSLRPLLAAKDAFMALKDQVPLIRKNDWDGNDLAGAPQDVKVEELYHRLEKLVTAVGQSVTASFLSKAGARPPRALPASTSVVAPPAPPPAQRTKSQKTKKAARSKSATSATQGLQGSPSPPLQPAHSAFSSSKNEVRGTDGGGAVSLASTKNATQCPHGPMEQSGAPAVGEVLRLKPLPPTTGADDWWKTASSPDTSGGAKTRPAEAAAPLVPTEAFLRGMRVESAPSGAAATERLSVQPVFQNVRTVPNVDTALTAANLAHPGGFNEDPWSLAPTRRQAFPADGGVAATAGSLQQQQQPALVSLSAVPTVVMPTSATGANSNNRANIEGNGFYDRSGGVAISPTRRQHRRSTIEKLTQLPSAASAGGKNDVGAGPDSSLDFVAREPITSITGGNFAVNTEYLYRVAPKTIPAGPSFDASTVAEAVTLLNDGSTAMAPHPWADVDDDYFYFGRPVEHRIAPGDAVVNAPPYITVAPTLSSGKVGLSPPVGSVVGSQRVNAELVTKRRPSTTRRSASSSRSGEGYRSSTASQAQKAQTARPVRKEGPNSKSFYTPGELQLMQARERLSSKAQKH